MSSAAPTPSLPRPPHRVRMIDVARRAGVSRALVSLVFQGKPGASPANRERIFAAAAELGYSPDVNAQRLRQGVSPVVGVVFEGHDPFTALTLDAAHQAVTAGGDDLVLTMSSPAVPLPKALRTLVDQRARAVLVISSAPWDEEAVRVVGRTPVVLLGTYPQTLPDGSPALVSAAHTDDDAGMRLVVDHLADLGHRHIAVVRVRGRRSGDVRADAARDQARRRGVEVVELSAGGYDQSSGVAAARRMLTFDRRPTALVAANDELALGALHVLHDAGLSVREDVSVTGFDDAGSGSSPAVASLGLTTVHQDVGGMVTEALAHMRAVVAGEAEPTELVLPPRLVVRSSTAAPRA